MKVFLGLHKTVDDKWTTPGLWYEEPSGVMCRFDDGSCVIVVSDGRVMWFDADGNGVGAAQSPQGADGYAALREIPNREREHPGDQGRRPAGNPERREPGTGGAAHRRRP